MLLSRFPHGVWEVPQALLEPRATDKGVSPIRFGRSSVRWEAKLRMGIPGSYRTALGVILHLHHVRPMAKAMCSQGRLLFKYLTISIG